MTSKGTIIAAMSGGVDSSVAAGLLLQEGYNVIGATLNFHSCDSDDVTWCCGLGALSQARSVCGTLGIRHYTIDCAEQFEAAVLRPSWEEYSKGRTPSPCIVCNQRIKFGLLGDLAAKLGAQGVATGHYAQILRDTQEGTPRLMRGLDPSKDQSYFLFSMTDDQLKTTLFPLGGLEKSKVRQLAAQMGFSNADRPDSQDACFDYPQGFAEGLRMRFSAPARMGIFVDTQGKELGKHQGIHRFTIGQRKGLGIALGAKAYVAHIDSNSGQVVVGDSVSLESSHLFASNVNWLPGCKPTLPNNCQTQIRYRHKAVECTLSQNHDGRIRVDLLHKQRAVAPGQAVVFYDGKQVLGGGWIDAQ